jgi:ABC-type Fe3+ transport system substrate-binding protein
MGVDYEPAQIEYWNAEHHGTQKTRYDWVKEQKVQYIDLRWKEFLTPETQKRIAGDPLVNSYLAEQGLQLTADGLTLHGGD